MSSQKRITGVLSIQTIVDEDKNPGRELSTASIRFEDHEKAWREMEAGREKVYIQNLNAAVMWMHKKINDFKVKEQLTAYDVFKVSKVSIPLKTRVRWCIKLSKAAQKEKRWSNWAYTIGCTHTGQALQHRTSCRKPQPLQASL